MACVPRSSDAMFNYPQFWLPGLNWLNYIRQTASRKQLKPGHGKSVTSAWRLKLKNDYLLQRPISEVTSTAKTVGTNGITLGLWAILLIVKYGGRKCTLGRCSLTQERCSNSKATLPLALTTCLEWEFRTPIGAMPCTDTVTMKMMICTLVTHTVKYGLRYHNRSNIEVKVMYR